MRNVAHGTMENTWVVSHDALRNKWLPSGRAVHSCPVLHSLWSNRCKPRIRPACPRHGWQAPDPRAGSYIQARDSRTGADPLHRRTGVRDHSSALPFPLLTKGGHRRPRPGQDDSGKQVGHPLQSPRLPAAHLLRARNRLDANVLASPPCTTGYYRVHVSRIHSTCAAPPPPRHQDHFVAICHSSGSGALHPVLQPALPQPHSGVEALAKPPARSPLGNGAHISQLTVISCDQVGSCSLPTSLEDCHITDIHQFVHWVHQ